MASEDDKPQQYLETLPAKALDKPFTTPKRHVIFGVASELSIKQVKVAQLLAIGEMTLRQVAKKFEIAESTILSWKRESEPFRRYLDEYRKVQRQVVLDHGAALQHNRLKRLERATVDLERLRDARAESLKDSVPGGDTGWLAHDKKSIGSGLSAEVIDVYEFDSAHYKEYRATLEQAAKEIGGAFLRPDVTTNVVVQTSVLATADTSATLNVLQTNDGARDI